MALLMAVAISASAQDSQLWLNNVEDAKTLAKEKGKPILMSFAGSDWCRPCIMLTKEVFEDEKFKAYAQENLVLLLLDFPRLKKNKLSDEQTQHNEKLAAQYNTTGEFPLVVLINGDGKVIAKTGYQKGGADNFIQYLESVL
ncbi:thioredoxin family protein [Fulvivirga lutea]|uniref:Thioredoxin family protein n=2 Tax=Fulvivirga lutea TaxID=2810512 RepID=A0A975A2B8_9BACT|nr:thioredoxin family protein [Fulvivirga lutea]